MTSTVEELRSCGEDYYRLERKSIPSHVLRDGIISRLDDNDTYVRKLRLLGVLMFDPAFIELGSQRYLLNHPYHKVVRVLDDIMNTDNLLLNRNNYSFINK